MSVYHVGQRIELHPATTAWMRGDRYGEIVSLRFVDGGLYTVRVKLDKSGKTVKVHPDNIYLVINDCAPHEFRAKP